VFLALHSGSSFSSIRKNPTFAPSFIKATRLKARLQRLVSYLEVLNKISFQNYIHNLWAKL
jgi:hypothetical protein